MAAWGTQGRGTRIKLAVMWPAVLLALILALAACTDAQSTTSSTEQSAPPESSTAAAAGEIVTDVSAPPGVEFSGAPAAGGFLFILTYTGERADGLRGLCWKASPRVNL